MFSQFEILFQIFIFYLNKNHPETTGWFLFLEVF
jgi:hypothetical protein